MDALEIEVESHEDVIGSLCDCKHCMDQRQAIDAIIGKFNREGMPLPSQFANLAACLGTMIGCSESDGVTGDQIEAELIPGVVAIIMASAKLVRERRMRGGITLN